MGQEWYYTQGGTQAGPVDVDALRGMFTAGQLGPDELVWTDGMGDWRRAGDVPTFFAPPAGGHVAAAPHATAQPLQYGVASSLNYYTPQVTLAYAGFWLRFCAMFIDQIILGVVDYAIELASDRAVVRRGGRVDPAIQMMITVLGWVIAWLYYALQESSAAQATLGKRALGIFVVDTRGRRLSFARASGRHFGKILSSLILGIGYLMAAFTERKQALHDQMADALVLKKTPEL